MSLRRMLSAGCLAAVALLGVQVAPAHAIIAGEKANHPAVVQIEIHDGIKDDGTPHRCTGTAISDRWIITAKHCIEGVSYQDPHAKPSMLKIFFSNDKKNPGQPTLVDRYVEQESSDMVLMHLAASHSLASYPKVATSHSYRKDEQVTLYGYGLDRWDAKSEPTWLRKATIKAIGHEWDLGAGDVTIWRGVNGGSSYGDSGGPVIAADGSLIGVNGFASHAQYPDSIAYSKSVDVVAYRDWFSKVAGV